MLAFFVTWIALPPVTVCSDPQSGLKGLQLPLTDRPFMVFTAIMMGFWFMWVQLSIALPLQIKELTGDTSSVSVLFTVSAVLAILLQVPALKLAQRLLPPIPIIVVGMISMGSGLGLVALTETTFQFYAALFFFSLGTVLVLPSSQTVIADVANPRARGAYFGVSSLSLAIGGGLGHICGGSTGRFGGATAATGSSLVPVCRSRPDISRRDGVLLLVYADPRSSDVPHRADLRRLIAPGRRCHPTGVGLPTEPAHRQTLRYPASSLTASGGFPPQTN